MLKKTTFVTLGLSLMILSLISSYVTMSGEVERKANPFTGFIDILYRFKLSVDFSIPALSVAFFSGLMIIVYAIFKMK